VAGFVRRRARASRPTCRCWTGLALGVPRFSLRWISPASHRSGSKYTSRGPRKARGSKGEPGYSHAGPCLQSAEIVAGPGDRAQTADAQDAKPVEGRTRRRHRGQCAGTRWRAANQVVGRFEWGLAARAWQPARVSGIGQLARPPRGAPEVHGQLGAHPELGCRARWRRVRGPMSAVTGERTFTMRFTTLTSHPRWLARRPCVMPRGSMYPLQRISSGGRRFFLSSGVFHGNLSGSHEC
jgi:hypothetical protein